MPCAAASVAQQPSEPSWIAERRACEGSPRRSVGKALFQTTIINVFYELANLVAARSRLTSRQRPGGRNMEQGWVWDPDDFTVNQIGTHIKATLLHRRPANGLSFYESAARDRLRQRHLGVFWRANHASLNDFINTTLGGIALGEVFHRAAWLVRYPNCVLACRRAENRDSYADHRHRFSRNRLLTPRFA